MVGSSIIKNLVENGYNNIIKGTRDVVDFSNQYDTNKFFNIQKPEYVFLAAAKVGGINANNIYRAEFLYQNIMIEANIINASHENKVKKLLFLGSSCIYPKNSPQPIKEEYLLTNELEYTNEPYAIAKIAGIKLCESYKSQYNDNFISVMPCNLYGINDHYDLKTSHVLPTLIRKFHEAKLNNYDHVEIWGSGEPMREFLYVDDLADACIFLMHNYNDNNIVNIGTGEDISIKDLALLIKEIVGYDGRLVFNKNMPNGTYRKLLDVSKMTSLGWVYKTKLEEGIKNTYNDFIKQLK